MVKSVPAEWNVYYNLPHQSQSGVTYPEQFIIRDAFIERINQLNTGHEATLTTFTFSANEGAGTIINAIDAALDRGAQIRFIVDNEAETDIQYGGRFSLRDLTARTINPLRLTLDDHAGGIMHTKLGLFDYGINNKVVMVASWNFTLAASANQWNIAVEIRSDDFYSIYKAETDELFAGRFHDHADKSHAHDGAVFYFGNSGANMVRFAPYPDSGSTAEADIIELINGAEHEIIFALNKLNRTAVRDALIAAAARGVKISGVMPRSDTDAGKVSHAVYSSLTHHVQFFTAAARADYSAADSGQQDLIHAKYMVIDPGRTNAAVIHGSANWTAEGLAGLNQNDETVLILRHTGIAQKFTEHFQRVTGTGIFSGGNSVLAEWNFADSDRVADAGVTANLNAEITRVPEPAAYSFTSGMLTANGWNGGAHTAYWEIQINTVKHRNIKLSSVQTATATGPANFKLQYQTGGDEYTDVAGGEVIIPAANSYALLTRVPLPPECNNQSNVFLRWLMVNNTAVNGAAVASAGAGRIDTIMITGDAYNQPPVIDVIDDQNVFEGTEVSFPVTARDAVDGDSFSLRAESLPYGAIFTNGIFRWNPAAPAGSYTVLFIAEDKDGATTNAVRIAVTPRPQFFISEVADPAGTGGDTKRFVELYNAGATEIDLAAERWFLCRQNNGGTSWSAIALTGLVDAVSTYVIAKSADDFYGAYGIVPDQESTGVDGNGIDAYFLFRSGDHRTGILIDMFGERDVNGSGTNWDYTDGRAERKRHVLHPSTGWDEEEWIITDAGVHEMNPGVHGPRPEFINETEAFVFAGDKLRLTITATNPVCTDVITLSIGELPVGATFSGATGTNSVTGILAWDLPLYGVHTAKIFAEGFAGTRELTLKITVASSAQIAGNFYGWSGDTIFKLNNGQFWQQTVGGVKRVAPLYRPAVTITNQFGQRRMIVAGVSGYVEVEQIDIIETFITGKFSGLHYETVFELTDGTAWKQISFEHVPMNELPARVWRFEKGGQLLMRLIGVDDRVLGTCTVEPAAAVSGATDSRISGWFRGFYPRRIFVLENGECWRQISLTAVDAFSFRPAVTITNWLNSGIFRLSVAGIPAPVEVEKIHLMSSGVITNSFSGLRYGKIFQLNSGDELIQVSFENIRCVVAPPAALLWEENRQTVMLVRASENETIGSCIVVHSSGDEDGDGVSNAAEMIAGTDLFDANSLFTIQSAAGITLQWSSVPERIYSIEHTVNLTEPFQMIAAGIMYPQNSWTDSVHRAGQNFYRVQIRPADETHSLIR
ncbi:MAG: phospholipase D-like domain-containing protein [Kiritimatiellales bacterium]